MSLAQVHLKEGGPINIGGVVGAMPSEGGVFTIRSVDADGSSRDTIIPRENVVAISVNYND